MAVRLVALLLSLVLLVDHSALCRAEEDVQVEEGEEEEEINFEEAVEQMKGHLTKMGNALKSAAGSGDTPALAVIAALANNCQAALDKAEKAENVEDQYDVLQEAISKRGEWIAALTQTEEKVKQRHKKEEAQDNFEQAMHGSD